MDHYIDDQEESKDRKMKRIGKELLKSTRSTRPNVQNSSAWEDFDFEFGFRSIEEIEKEPNRRLASLYDVDEGLSSGNPSKPEGSSYSGPRCDGTSPLAVQARWDRACKEV